MLVGKDSKDNPNTLEADVHSLLTSVPSAPGRRPQCHMLWGSGNADCCGYGALSLIAS